MSASISSPTDPAAGPLGPEIGPLIDEPAYLITAAQYVAMAEAGVFEDDRVELWEGRIYAKMAKNIPHDICASKANEKLVRTLPRGWFVGNEYTVTLGPRNAPLPDLVVLRGRQDDYRGRRPESGDVGLIIELAETSLRTDTGPKLRGYARAGVLEYWVVNLVAGVIQVYRRPIREESRYAWERIFGRGESIELTLTDSPPISILVDELLPAP